MSGLVQAPPTVHLRDLRHALGAGNIAQSCSHQSWIAVFKHGLQIMRDLLALANFIMIFQ